MPAKETYCVETHRSHFDTEDKCREFLMQVRWNGTPVCHHCQNDRVNYYLSTRKIFKCSSCKKQFSVTQGTIFERSKVPLTKWFKAMYYFTNGKRGVSSIQLGKWLGVKQHTAWFMQHRLREALKDENNIILRGIVEADECHIGPDISRNKRLQIAKKNHKEEQLKNNELPRRTRNKLGIKFKRGRKKGSTKEVLQQKKIEREGRPYDSHESEKNIIPFEKVTVVLGMMERNGRVVMKKLGKSIKCINRKEVFPHLINHIHRDSTLITDEHVVYDATSEIFNEHLSVNHQKGYVINGVHINSIENAWNHFQRTIDGTYFHISYRHFDRYLDENTFRLNRRNESAESLFQSLVPLIFGKRLTYKKLIEKEVKLAA